MKVPAVLSARLPRMRRKPADLDPGTGTVRLDRRTKQLTKRLRPGDIAVIDHVDLDRVSAESLVTCGVSAVLNVARGISGRYPNLGPQLLVDAGVTVVDNVPAAVFTLVREGERLAVRDGALYRGDTRICAGTPQDAESVAAAMTEARAGLSAQLESFALNTMEYIRQERELLVDGSEVPDIRTAIQDRHVLIVVRGYHHREDLATLRPYIREFRPVMLGVDGGADALVDAGYRPDLIVGDFDSISDDTLRRGAELVVHAYPDGRAPGLDRVRDLGVAAEVYPVVGTSEDAAMLLADGHGAALIVTVGTHATLLEFLDKGRSGMSSTFLTRLRVGGKLVDAKGVSRLYRSRISPWSLLGLVAAAFVAIVAAVYSSPVGQFYTTMITAQWEAFYYWLTGLVS